MASLEDPKLGFAYPAMAIAAIPLALTVISKLISPSFDAREPPPLWPKVPLIGHIISILSENATFYIRLFKEKHMPICSLPLLNRKIYVINSPALVAAAMRSTDISFDPVILELGGASLGLTPFIHELLSDEAKQERYMEAIKTGLRGPSLAKLNVTALNLIVSPLNSFKPGQELDIPDIWIWLRDIMGRGIAEGLFGEKNPFTPELFAKLWDYEKGLGLLSQRLDFFAPKAAAARRAMHEALREYYEKKHDQFDSVADVMRNRAEVSRDLGVSPKNQGIMEFSILWVGSTNTIPTLHWCFVNVFSRPELVASIAAEVAAYATIEPSPDGKGRSVTLDVVRIEKGCPVLSAAYRETLRVYVNVVGIRRVLRDTTLIDPESGREYLLHGGVDIHWQTGVTHNMPEVWGEGATLDFKPSRFMDVSTQEEKRRRGAMIPFGGGKHLCPGRNFALAENLGLLAVLALGYEVEGVEVPDSADPVPGVGTRSPVWGDMKKSMKLRRKEEWGDVTWKFTS